MSPLVLNVCMSMEGSEFARCTVLLFCCNYDQVFELSVRGAVVESPEMVSTRSDAKEDDPAPLCGLLNWF